SRRPGGAGPVVVTVPLAQRGPPWRAPAVCRPCFGVAPEVAATWSGGVVRRPLPARRESGRGVGGLTPKPGRTTPRGEGTASAARREGGGGVGGRPRRRGGRTPGGEDRARAAPREGMPPPAQPLARARGRLSHPSRPSGEPGSGRISPPRPASPPRKGCRPTA